MRLIDADAIQWELVDVGYIPVITKEEIDELPTVDAVPVRRAHWIWKGDEGDSRFMCSECKCKEDVPTCMGVPDIWEYCPNCGARMDERKKE